MSTLRKMDSSEVGEILQKHQLWLSGNTQGKRADFSNANLRATDLRSANLRRANLRGASLMLASLRDANLMFADLRNTNLMDANLMGANLRAADLKAADLRDADLRNTNLMDADLRMVNFTGANLIGASLDDAIVDGANFNNTIGYKKDILNRLESEIQDKQKQLEESQTAEDRKILETEIAALKKELEKKEKEIKKLKESLSAEIKSAQKSLADSLGNTDERIKDNKEESRKLKEAARRLFYLDILLIIIIPVLIWNPLDWNLFSTIQYKFIMLSSMLGHWAILFYSLPILTIFLMATTLLRHDQKLINEIRHFSEMKHEIELFSGLLEASQHAASSFGEPEKAAKYVEDTFTLIRNKLLKVERPAELKSDDKDELDNIKTVDLLSKITDLLNKLSK